MHCQACNHHNDANAKYCEGCGADQAFSNKCGACGAAMSSSARFCGACGSKVIERQAARSDAELQSASGQAELKETFFKVFPNMKSCEPATRLDYWSAVVATALIAGACAVAGTVIILITGVMFLAQLAANLLMLYGVIRLKGHVFVGRAIDAGLLKYNTFRWLGGIAIGSELLSTFHPAFYAITLFAAVISGLALGTMGSVHSIKPANTPEDSKAN